MEKEKTMEERPTTEIIMSRFEAEAISNQFDMLPMDEVAQSKEDDEGTSSVMKGKTKLEVESK